MPGEDAVLKIELTAGRGAGAAGNGRVRNAGCCGGNSGCGGAGGGTAATGGGVDVAPTLALKAD